MNLTANNGFSTPVQYSCSDPASESVCNGPSGYISSSTAASSTITATAPVTQLHKPFGGGSGIFYAALLPGLLGIIFTVGSKKTFGPQHAAAGTDCGFSRSLHALDGRL